MPKKVEWICNECDTGPCHEYERKKPYVCIKGKGKPNFRRYYGSRIIQHV